MRALSTFGPVAGLISSLLMAGCPQQTTTPTDLCAVEMSLSPSEALPGDTVDAVGGPFTFVADTTVRVDGFTAEVLEIERSEDCLFCDACVESAGCTGCERSCPDCDAICETCIETTRFVVPEVPPGERPVVLLNRYGATDSESLLVLGDTGYTGSRRRQRHQGWRILRRP